MLNFKYPIIVMLSLLIACDKERDIIVEEIQIPDTVELIDANFKGTVVNTDQVALQNATVTISYDKYKLGTTNTDSEGHFQFTKAPTHKTQSLLTFTKDGYSPNYFTQTFTNFGEYSVSPMLKQLVIYEPLTEVIPNLKVNEHLTITVPDGIVPTPSSLLEVQYLDFKIDDPRTLLPTQSSQGPLKFSHAYYVNISENGKSLAWNPNAKIILHLDEQLTKKSNKEVWHFDERTSIWVKSTPLEQANGKSSMFINAPGYYAVVSNCDADTEAPVVYANASTILKTTQTQVLEVDAQFFDNASYDNCSEDLTFTVRKLIENCSSSNPFAPKLKICVADIAKTIDIELKVQDESGNFNTAILKVVVEDADCPNDQSAPVVIGIGSLTTSALTLGVNTIIGAITLNSGSFDNCTPTSEMKYEIRKVVDVCSTGPINWASSITLCAAERGTTFNVELKAIDKAGNFNTTFVPLTVLP